MKLTEDQLKNIKEQQSQEYKTKRDTPLFTLSSVAANTNIEPKIGPMHGVQPKPNANPITYGNRIFLDSFASNLFSKFK